MNRHRPEPIILALDIGTSSVRSALFDKRAQPLPHSSASEKYRVHHSVDHGAELAPAVLLRSAKKCLQRTRRCLTKHATPAIAGSGFWHSLLGLDRTGKPITPVYTWGDSRGAPDAARLRDELDERVIQERTGCMLRASFWPAKLLWLRRTNPTIFRRVARWVSPAEWIFDEIFSVGVCSHSMASGTGLYNFAARDWDEEMLELTGLTSKQLGPLIDRVESGKDVIFPAIGDGAASNLGSGACAPGVVAINVGTSAAVRTIPDRETPLPFGLFRYVVDQRRALLGGAVSNAGNLHAWCLRELRLSPNDRKIEQLLRTSTPAALRLTVLPFWVSERAPTWPEDLNGVIVGLSQATTAADLLRAATGAVCHRLAEIFEGLEIATGPVAKIIVSGGILHSPAALQILADSLGRDLVPTADQEASMRGAAVHALEQLGHKVPAPKFAQPIRHNRTIAEQVREERRRQRELEKLLHCQEPLPL
ncbi:MAG TPA: gluconokinase [Chthoniobacterales bacterium]|jgi:gluconokinase